LKVTIAFEENIQKSMSLNFLFCRQKLSIGSTLFAGGMAGICNWLVAIPMDVVKSRLQAGTLIFWSFLVDSKFFFYSVYPNIISMDLF